MRDSEAAASSRGQVVGSYVAEEVARATYELVNRSRDDVGRDRNLPSLHSPRGSSTTRRRRVEEQIIMKCTVLPALATITPLLQGAAEADLLEQEERDRQQQAREARRAEKDERQRQAFVRLYRGCGSNPQPPGFGGAALEKPPGKATGDEDVVQSLTQPLSYFTEKSPRKSGMIRRRRFSNYRKLFQASLVGTSVADKRFASPEARMVKCNSMRQVHPALVFPTTPRTASKKLKCAVDRLDKSMEDKGAAEILSKGRASLLRHAFLSNPETVEEKVSEDKVWKHTLDDAFAKSALTPAKRERAQLMRLFVFGSMGTDLKNGQKDREKVLKEPIGTKDQIKMAVDAFTKISSDAQFGVTELRAHVEKICQDLRRAQALKNFPVWETAAVTAFCNPSQSLEDNIKSLQTMCERVSTALFGRKAYIEAEDVIRSIWPCCGLPELKSMRTWWEELLVDKASWRVPTPEVITEEELESLRAVFRFFDHDGSGGVSVNEFISSGLIDKEYAEKLIAEHDADSSECLEIMEFCELFCQNGFRCHAQSLKGTTAEGQRIIYDQRVRGWRLEEADALLDAIYNRRGRTTGPKGERPMERQVS